MLTVQLVSEDQLRGTRKEPSTGQAPGSSHDSELCLPPPNSNTKQGPQSCNASLHCSSQLVLVTVLREGPSKYAHFTGDQTKHIQGGVDKKGPAVMASQAFSLQGMRRKEGHSLCRPPRSHCGLLAKQRSPSHTLAKGRGMCWVLTSVSVSCWR